MNAIDSGKVTILAVLDMSAAFDTLDHNITLGKVDPNKYSAFKTSQINAFRNSLFSD